MAAKHQVALPGRSVGGGDEHVRVRDSRGQAAFDRPGQVAGPGGPVGRVGSPAQFEGPLEEIVSEVGQLHRGVAPLVGDDLRQVLGAPNPSGRQIVRQTVDQLAEQDGELVLVLAGTRPGGLHVADPRPAASSRRTASSNSASVAGWSVRQLVARAIRRPATPARARSRRPGLPVSTSRSRATSSTVRAIGPGLSWLALMGTIPPVGTAPTVGLIPATPLSDAGQVIEPSVSVPIASGASPAAIAAAEPDEEPPGLRSSAQGLPVRPPIADQPDVERADRMLAHSDRLVVPRITAPASCSRRTRGASPPGGRFARLVAPAVDGRPATSMLSFTSTGMPCSGPWAPIAPKARATWRTVGETASTLRSPVGESGVSRAAIRSSRQSTRTPAETPERWRVNTSA